MNIFKSAFAASVLLEGGSLDWMAMRASERKLSALISTTSPLQLYIEKTPKPTWVLSEEGHIFVKIKKFNG